MSNHSFTARLTCANCKASVYVDVAITPNTSASTDEGIKVARVEDAREGLSVEALDRAVTRADAPFGHGHPEDAVTLAKEMLDAPGAPTFETPEARAHAVDALAARLSASKEPPAADSSTENPEWPTGVGFERPGPV